MHEVGSINKKMIQKDFFYILLIKFLVKNKNFLVFMFGVGAALFLPGAGVDPILPESVPGP